MPAIMIQGCGSDVGKTMLVAGLCRLLANRGFRVRPFKPQNMSNNAAVTPDGGEIGRSTALQSLACRVPPSVHMNPILLKPQSDTGAQLIVRGRRAGNFPARAYAETKRELLEVALDSYRTLAREADWIIVEGAGSPAETNLRAHDIANMGFAHAADLPVILVGDINRGHVIASVVGAHAVLDAADRERIAGFIINKFRGDARLFEDGIATIVERTGWQRFGIVPWLPDAAHLPAEDAVQLEHRNAQHSNGAGKRVRISVVHLPHIANFDDFDPLKHEPNVDLRFVSPREPLPFESDLLILPGSKATIADLALLRACGWHHDVHAYLRRGGRVLGICAGYQMLGRCVRDPLGIEGVVAQVEGFGCFDVDTEMTSSKQLREVRGIETTTGAPIRGYEMHVGRSSVRRDTTPMVRFEDGTSDGEVAAQGRVLGCHLHGIFHAPEFRGAFLSRLALTPSSSDHAERTNSALDSIAESLAQVLDLRLLEQVATRRR
ncbi:MAG: cobyric acid synthase [Steroidobacteraceae bacterium]